MHFCHTLKICDELSDLDKVVSTERFTIIYNYALPPEKWSIMKLQTIRDPDLNLEQIQLMMIFMNHSER